MLEIFLVLIVALAATRRRGRGRPFPLRKVRISPRMSLGTLATQIVLLASLTGTADGAYRAVSIKATWSLVNGTAGDGPISVGFAHGDYTILEIKECLESATSISIGNKQFQERANRLVRVVGTLGGAGTSKLNDGQQVKTRLNWAIPIGTIINIFAYNESAGGLTTGSILDVVGNLWVKDY